MRDAFAPLLGAVRSLASGIGALLAALFGRWHWVPPAWFTLSRAQGARAWRHLAVNPARAGLLAVLLASTLGGYLWLASRPKPHYVTFTVSGPQLTTYNDNGVASINSMKVVFSESAAPLRQVKTALTAGIDLSPAAAGTWFWTSDRELQFTPQDDWPVDAAFTVKLSKKDLVARQVQLDRYSFTFRSQPFSARITESQFYQDPSNPTLKKIVATVTFSHPVEARRFESRVSLAVAKDAEYLGLTPDSRHFTVAYDKLKLAAYVHSSALAVPRDDTSMTLRIDRGVRAARGGNDTPAPLEAVVRIPGRSSLTFSDARVAVVDNARYEPEQILLLTSSSPVVERAFDTKVSVRLLPVRHPRQPKENRRPYEWLDPGEIGADILAACDTVGVTYVPSDEGGNTSHGFRFNAPVGRYLHVLVQADVQGTGGYVSAKPLVATVKVVPYPQALTFLGKGALLPLSGDRRVGFLARDVGRVQIEIGRVLPNQLQHLAPEMWDFSQPSLYGGLEDKLVERFVTVRDYGAKPPGRPTYDSIDVGQYLADQTQSRRGLFLLHVRHVGRGRPAAIDEGDDSQGDGGGGDGPVADQRLILVTDLGFIVKQAKDGSRDVFVQSIGTGLPVDGARVELTGNNGLPVQAATTDAGGRAQLPKPPPGLRRERTPLLLVVQKDADFSFLPLNAGSRDLDLSRFDSGGVVSAKSAQQLSTYLFSDRGIYRPGETTHLGAITRTADWKASLGGLPLDLEITDPRGVIVSRRQLTASAASFDEISYTSPASAPTGTYEATAYLARDAEHRESIGSTSFKVQEFEPDRMKVQLDLAAAPVEGWLRPDEVKARMTVAHLFGEAASNRRVEGELSLTPALPRFNRHADYRFSIGEVLKEPYHERLAAVVTDDNGVAEFALDLKRFVGRAYRLNVLGRAYEAEGGRNVAAENSAIVSEAPYLVGVKPDGDLSFVRRTSARAASWLAVNQRLAPVPADALTLEWVQRKFVSVLTKQGNGTLQYVSRQMEIVRGTRSVRIASGGSSFLLPTDEPGDFALVLRNASGAALNSLSYTVAGQANLSRSLERETELQIQLDKPAYAGGDTIRVSIRAPYIGAGLITIERDRVYRYQWFKTTTTSSVQQITLPADFEGNGYVSVQFLRDPSSDELFMSPLSYGVAPFAPNLAARTQEIALVAPRRVKPGAILTMRLLPGEPSRVAVLAVDEGILQVARYKNPDPLGYFFQKRMLEVRTKQILDLILPDLKRFIALAAPGGDADGGFARHLNPFNKKRKPAVAYWSGVVDVGPEGRELTYTVPDYFNGRLRIIAIGAGGRRMGVTEAVTEVRGDFILTPNVPATVAPGDEFIVSVGVFNNSAGSGAVRLDAQLGPGLSLVGAANVDLQIAEKKEGVGEFRVKANAVLGPAALAFTARRGAASARVEESVGVRPATAFRTQLTLGRVDGASATAPLARDMYSERRKVEAAVSLVPLVWGQGLTAYLDNYEYTCTEQLISKGVSALMLVARPEFGSIRKPDLQPLDATFSTLRGRANDQDGLGLWASTPQTAEFPTVYAAHFLVEAQEHGQRIPQDLLARLDAWLTRFALTPASSLGDARLRAYAVYLLARQGIRPNAALSNVEQELANRYTKAWPTDLAAAYLASTYRLMQRNDDADRIVKAVPWSTQKKDFGDEVYYDAVVHDAQLLYLLAKHFPARLGAAPHAALETISHAVSGSRASSLSAAYTLLALDGFAKAAGGTATLGVSEIGKDGRERAVPLPSGAVPKVGIAETAAQVRFSQRGAALAYFAINESGFDRRPPSGEVSQGVEIVREFVDAKGTPLSRVAVGDEFFVRLRLRATSRDRQPQIAIVDLLPGGVEPVLELQAPADSSTPDADPAMQRRRGMRRSLPVGLPDKSDWSPDHVDMREDRVILYGDAGKDIGTFVYRVRANNAGTFQVPPAFAEGLYNRTIVGSTRASTLEVVKK
jgi:alpha-2-macroglobulin